MERRRQTIRIAAGVITAVVLVHAVIAIGLFCEGYHVTVISTPVKWSYRHASSDGAIVDHHWLHKETRQYGVLYFTKSTTMTELRVEAFGPSDRNPISIIASFHREMGPSG